MEGHNGNNKRVRDDDSDESPESKHLLLDILDDFDSTADRDPSNQDLASVMKSFEEEILSQNDNDTPTLPTHVPFSGSESADSLPDLGYLLEASDDELGLPPTFSGTDETEIGVGDDILRPSPEMVGFGQMWGFEDEIPSYDSLEFGIPEEGNNNEESSVVFEGLFGPSDFSDFSWRTESLPAL
ncbi:uncharacterized protein LOC143882709 [Tasmannia lanceolata]|uniref:uncharacterized protein LOC143882709 n=1 Tax=Tasmannia lanceolata TaxID=3420 RepID=UPI004062E7B1